MESKLALVTGASSGIGLELARCFAEDGHRLVIVSGNADKLTAAQHELGDAGAPEVVPIVCDLTRPDGPDNVWEQVGRAGELPEFLVLNAGVGKVGDFVDSPLEVDLEIIDLNVVAVVKLAKHFLPRMVERGSGRVLITSSVVALAPSPRQAIYSATKAFDFAFAACLADELKDTGVTATALLPSATETEFFARADALETKIGRGSKADPADVARAGYDSMMAGKGHVVSPFSAKIVTALAGILPETVLTSQARAE